MRVGANSKNHVNRSNGLTADQIKKMRNTANSVRKKCAGFCIKKIVALPPYLNPSLFKA